jgi:tRNA (cytidine/uridine-2'-O-)-methyltransferase
VKLRYDSVGAPFHVVLVNPEIPQNTGNIARMCAATGSVLHLVGSLGFDTDEKAVRRAGLDYWHLVRVHQHADFDACMRAIGCTAPLLFATSAARSYLDAPYAPGGVLVFGRESVGLPDELLERFEAGQHGIPMLRGSVRSLNLANAVAIVLFRALEAVGSFRAPFME